MSENEEVLHGGNVNEVVHKGNAVHRSTNWSPFVHELLIYLEKQNFEGAPRFLGIDNTGREVLSYIPGEVPGDYYPDFKPYIWTDNSLIKSAELLSKYHDAVKYFKTSSTETIFEVKQPEIVGWEEDVICHNDAAPYNIVYKDEEPLALIDFDLAAPGPRIWDIVYMLYTSIPLGSFAINYATGKTIPYISELHSVERKRRIHLFFKAYGMEIPNNLGEWTICRIKAMCDTLIYGAKQGNRAYEKMIEEGHVKHYKREIIFLEEHFEEWE